MFKTSCHCTCAHKYLLGDRFRSFFKDGTEYGVIITGISNGEYRYENYHYQCKSKFFTTEFKKFEEFYKDFKPIGKNVYTYQGQKEIKVTGKVKLDALNN